MTKIFYASQMREIDRKCSEIAGIDSLILMENAALRCIEELNTFFDSLKNKKIACFCGKGNNGGDGLVIARHLIRLGANPTVFLVCGKNFSVDAAKNFAILENMDCEITDDLDNIENEIYKYDFVIDSIFGTGIYGTVSDFVYNCIDIINKSKKYVLSVDVPSGVNADTGEICGICVKATKTVTFVGHKPAEFLFPSCEFFGETTVGNICTPEFLMNEFLGYCIDEDFIYKNFPRRFDNSQKGDYGKLLIIGGSDGMSGAVALAAESALNCGAGLVYVASTESVCDIVDTLVSECVTYRLPSHNGSIANEAIGHIGKLLKKVDSVLFGPGISASDSIGNILEFVMKNCTVPLVVDADGLNVLSKNMSLIENCNCNLIFTPHEVEMSRLLGCTLEEVISNRIELSESFAQEYGVTLILKGHHTIVTASDGLQYINITGNSGMATGGSGDVLAGAVAHFCARCKNEHIAAAISVFLHGMSGDIAKDFVGIDSVRANLLVKYLPQAIKHFTIQ